MTIYWGRYDKIKGLAAIGINNDRRSYVAKIKTKTGRVTVGVINNSSYSSLSSDGNAEWSISMLARPNSLIFKRKFKEKDIEEAKRFFVWLYNRILIAKNESEGVYWEYKQKLLKHE